MGVRVHLFLPLFLILTACKSREVKESSSNNNTMMKGNLLNLTGLDGCGWVIKLQQKLEDGTEKIEPINLPNFKITLTEGQSVIFSFHEISAASTCMAGKLVELDTITEN